MIICGARAWCAARVIRPLRLLTVVSEQDCAALEPTT